MPSAACVAPAPVIVDLDSDGHRAAVDCDDHDGDAVQDLVVVDLGVGYPQGMGRRAYLYPSKHMGW